MGPTQRVPSRPLDSVLHTDVATWRPIIQGMILRWPLEAKRVSGAIDYAPDHRPAGMMKLVTTPAFLSLGVIAHVRAQ